MASLAAWFLSLGGSKTGARLADDGSGLGEVGSGVENREAVEYREAVENQEAVEYSEYPASTSGTES